MKAALRFLLLVAMLQSVLATEYYKNCTKNLKRLCKHSSLTKPLTDYEVFHAPCITENANKLTTPCTQAWYAYNQSIAPVPVDNGSSSASEALFWTFISIIIAIVSITLILIIIVGTALLKRAGRPSNQDMASGDVDYPMAGFEAVPIYSDESNPGFFFVPAEGDSFYPVATD